MVDLLREVLFSAAWLDLVFPVPLAASDLTLVTEVEGTLAPLV